MTHDNTVRRQICCLSRASGVIVVVSRPSMVSVMFRLVRSWLFCSGGFRLRVCSSHVSGWLTSVEVFAAVPLGVFLLSVVLGRGILCGPLERWSAGKLFHRGIRIQAAAASCTHVSCSGAGAGGTGARAVDKKSTSARAPVCRREGGLTPPTIQKVITMFLTHQTWTRVSVYTRIQI